MKEFDSVKDSGDRTEYTTGARRDKRPGKGRFDLIPTSALRRLAKHFENGGIKYGFGNWEKGIPLADYLDSAIRHLMAVSEGLDDEDHAAAVLWNVMCLMVTLEEIEAGNLPEELATLPYQLKAKRHGRTNSKKKSS